MPEFTPRLRAAFIKQLRAACARQGITQQTLAELSGIHFTSVNRIFAGSQNLTLDTAERLAYSANLDAAELFAAK